MKDRFWIIIKWLISARRTNATWSQLLTLALGLLIISGCQLSSQTPLPPPIKETFTLEIKPNTTSTPTLSPTPVPSETAMKTTDCLVAGLPEIACSGVSANDEWTPIIREFDGFDMVLIPAGCFMMGNADGLPREHPVHEICFNLPFWIDLTETTVDQFAQFFNSEDVPEKHSGEWLNTWGEEFGWDRIQLSQQNDVWVPELGDANHPIHSITGFGADANCRWRGVRLPTEAEWEYAARGPDSLLYPWGNEFYADYVVRLSGKTPDPEVGSKPQGASWVGALDMSSSLYEWTSTVYAPYPYNAHDGRETAFEEDPSSERVLRGGSWYHADGVYDDLRATGRFRIQPNFASRPYGFRCARSIHTGE
jgi:iron(II)-dependent oxidoreductase